MSSYTNKINSFIVVHIVSRSKAMEYNFLTTVFQNYEINISIKHEISIK